MSATPPVPGSTTPAPRSLWRRLTHLVNPSREHSAYSATVLVMGAVTLSRIIGYLREAYIAWAFGAGHATDAYVAAFTIPDFLVYMLAGGSISTTFISIYSRFLAEKKEADGEKTFSVIVTVMASVFVVLLVLVEIFARPISATIFPKFGPEELDLCVSMTRILLPMQLFFYVGAIVQAVLYSRRLFLVPSITPLIYNSGIIVGGVVLSRVAGIHALAIGALAGAFAGPFALASLAAWNVGLRYRPSFDTKNPAFREWVRLTIPLMLGVSLVTADDWIIRYFASGGTGDIARLNYAKRLFAVPMAILGQAVGQASLPFFARLFNEGKLREFGRTVNDSVSRIAAASVLFTSLMMVTALPAVDLVYRRGHFSFDDSRSTATYFFLFSASLIFWASQGLYSRAFYAANDTFTPMVACTAITVLSVPVYRFLFASLSTRGLAFASDVGIMANTLALAFLLHRAGRVPLSGLRWRELGKAALAALAAGYAGAWVAAQFTPAESRLQDFEILATVGTAWLAVCAIALYVLRSELPRELLFRRRAPGAGAGDAPPNP